MPRRNRRLAPLEAHTAMTKLLERLQREWALRADIPSDIEPAPQALR